MDGVPSSGLVQGCRLPSGGGRVATGAMPWSHRWLGNPFFSWLARLWFRTSIHDIYCGMRAFSRSAYERWALRCTGMEFATEMIIKASLYRDRVAEVPITLHPDGVAHGPHPGRTEASLGATATNELAVMVDTFRSLRVARQALDVEDRQYFRSWLTTPGS